LRLFAYSEAELACGVSRYAIKRIFDKYIRTYQGFAFLVHDFAL
jgi:hypothetical protein